MYTTRAARLVRAPRPAVYRLLLDPDAITGWRVPTGMTAQVHEFDAREGGSFRVSLWYASADPAAKSAADRDTYHGRFAELVPDRKVVEVVEFESSDRDLAGPMTMTTTLADAEDGTEVLIVHEGVPDGVRLEDNETGMRMALDNLARLAEGGSDAG